MKTKKKKLSDIPLELRAEEALKKAVADTIADHKRTGDPISNLATTVLARRGSVVGGEKLAGFCEKRLEYDMENIYYIKPKTTFALT